MRNGLIALMFFFLFFSVQAQEFQSEYPAYNIVPEFDCASQGMINRTGMNRVLLDWKAENISDSICDPLIGEKSGFFCDATQFSVMLSKRIDSLLEKAEIELLNLAGVESETAVVPEIDSFDSLTELGVKPEFDALLIADNYSEQFKNDFSDHFSGEFLSEKVSISKIEFSNYPKKSGWFKVRLSGPLYFDGEKIFPQGKVTVSFELDSNLIVLDEKLGMDFSKNPFFELPFDAPLGKDARDYGIDLKGDSFYINDEIKLKNIDSPGKKLEVNLGESFEETKMGFIALFDQSKQDSGELFLSFNPSIPGVVSMHLGENLPHKVYYALSDSQSSPKPVEFYGGMDYLLNWQISGSMEQDSFPVLKPNIACAGWQSDIPTAEFEAKPTEDGSISRHSVIFFPPNTAFSVQCISENGVNFQLNSYNGESFEFVDEINPVAGEWLANESLLEPNPWNGIFSLSDAVEEFKKDNACAGLLEGVSWIVWNRSELTSNIVVQEITEVDYELSTNEMCRLHPGDISSMTSGAFSEPESKLYWCEEETDCEAQGGRHFYSPQIEPCASAGQYCCYKPMNESERACLESTEPMEVYLNNEPPSKEFLDKLLRAWNSPALEESRGEEMDLSEAILHFTTEDWSVMAADGSMYNSSTRLNPLVLMAFFTHESGMASNPDFDASRKSMGNIRPRTDLLNKTLCVDASEGSDGFCRYNEWAQSARHWAFHIQKNYIENVGERIDTVEGILDKYAPESENDTEAYKESVKKRVCRWQSMWEKELEREEETMDVASPVVDWFKKAVKDFRPPKWFTNSIPQINGFVQKYVIVWDEDTDGDGIIDLRDKCDNERETYNRYQDTDGCPDGIEKAKAIRSGEIPASNRFSRLSFVPSSIRGKKVILFIPSDFDHSNNSKFLKKSKDYFDKFIEISGLESYKSKIELVALDVIKYDNFDSCRAVKTAPVKVDILTNSRKIESKKDYWNAVDSCAKDVFRGLYGAVPKNKNFRVVALVNTTGIIFYDSKTTLGQISGLAEFARAGPKNHVLAKLAWNTVSHELGHTFGFAEQYSAYAHLSQARAYNFVSNYYPGPLQTVYNFDVKNATKLYADYPKNTSRYPLCPSERLIQTDCPEFGLELAFSRDCRGRITSNGNKSYRSPMGSNLQVFNYLFDCFEQAAIIDQWGKS